MRRYFPTIRQFLPLVAFVLGACLLSYFAGFVARQFELYPYEQLKQAQRFAKHWKSELGFEPTKLLVPAEDPDRRDFVTYAEERLAPGNVLISGLISDDRSLFGVGLFRRDGTRVHYWPVDASKLVEGNDNRTVFDVFLHGLAVRRDGTLFANFDGPQGAMRVSPCGDVEWAVLNDAHHAVIIDYKEQIWMPLKGNAFGVVDASTGKILKSVEIVRDVIVPHKLHGHFDLRSPKRELDPEFKSGRARLNMGLHTNDIEIVSPALAAASPVFEAGDAIVSLRDINTIFAFNPDTLEPRWWQTGPWHRQHDPDLQPDGKIAVFDNAMGKGTSRILESDPVSRKVTVLFEGSEDVPLYSWQRGKHQVLENRNLLITSSQEGRVIEVSPDGDLLWEYNLIFDRDRNGLVNKAIILPESYFDDGVLDCRGH